MTLPIFLLLLFLAAVETLASYMSRIYSEFGKILTAEIEDNLDSWEELVEPQLGLTPRTRGHLRRGPATALPGPDHPRIRRGPLRSQWSHTAEPRGDRAGRSRRRTRGGLLQPAFADAAL